MASQGFFMLARKAFHPVDGDPFWREARVFSRYEAWLYLIQLAVWKRHTHQTKYGVLTLERGEFVASLRSLAEAWQWSKNKAASFLCDCEKQGRIKGQTKHHAGRVYLIVNYDTYQNVATAGGTKKRTDAGTDAGQTRDKKKNGEERRKKTATTSGADAPPDSAAAGAKYPGLDRATCDELFRHWVATHGAVDYGRFRKAIGPQYQVADAMPALDDVKGAMAAHREAVDEMDDREAGFETVERFAARLDHWRRLGGMPYSTPDGVLTERGRVLGSKALREQLRGLRAVA